MQIIVISDLHGKNIWKRATLLANPGDIVVFVGDYLDSFDVSTEKQVENLKEILEYKKVKGDNCVLLLGNHDFQYSKFAGKYERYSGFSRFTKEAASDILDEAIDKGLIKASYYHIFPNATNGILFTHAGVTKAWLKRAGLDKGHATTKELSEGINKLLLNDPSHFGFAVGAIDPSGDDVFQSPFWVRPESLRENRIDGVSQVVGHTPQDHIVNHYVYPYIYFTDVLDYTTEILVLDSTGSKIIKI